MRFFTLVVVVAIGGFALARQDASHRVTPAVPAPTLDLSRPLSAQPGAVLCPLEALLAPRVAISELVHVLEDPTAWDSSVRAAGCETVRAGVALEDAHPEFADAPDLLQATVAGTDRTILVARWGVGNLRADPPPGGATVGETP